MSRTPDKPDITAIKVSRFQKSEKAFSQNRTLQAEKKAQDKPQGKIKSALMLLFLLNKKFKSRMEHSFMKISLCKNTWSYKKIIAKYVSSILKSKIKSNDAKVFQKLKAQAKRVKIIKNACISLSSWLRMKEKNQKSLTFISILSKSNKIKSQVKQQPKYEIPSRPPITSSTRKFDRSFDAGKSVSASKLNLSKKIDFENDSDPSVEIAKIKKQNQQLKLMQLSEEAREALKKVQRFDRFIYAQEAEKVCKQPLTLQLKRLEKIKNSQKEMRGQLYDNELTITALFNHIKLVAEMNRDINELAKMKEKYDAQQAKRKQEQFKLVLQKKRNRGRAATSETLIKQLTENVEANLQKKQYDKARQDINTLITKHQKDQSVKDRIIFYQALLDSISRQRQAQNALQDTYKLSNTLSSIDLAQNENTVKALKQAQRQITILINKSLKNEGQNQKILSIYRSFEAINTSILQIAQLKPANEKERPNTLRSRQNDKALEEANKKVGHLQAELQASKSALNESVKQFEEVKTAYDNILVLNSEFENKIKLIFEKFQNRTDYKADIEELIKDKKFAQQKPFSLFFNLDSAYKHMVEQQVNTEITLIINFITSISHTEMISQQKSVSVIAQNFTKKYPKLLGLAQSVEGLVKQIVKSTNSETEIAMKESEKKVEKQVPIDQSKSRSLNEKIKSLQKINREQALKLSSIEKQRKQFESGKKPPTQSKSVQIFKNQATLNQNLQTELKQSKEKIIILQKQISTLKNNEKKPVGQKKQTKVDEVKKLQQQIKRLQEQVKKLQEEIKSKRQKQTQEKIQRNKEITVQTQLSKSVVSVSTILEGKNYKQLQIQSNKMLKVFEKDERLSPIATLIANLIKLLVEKQNTQLTKKKQLQSLTELQSKDKEKFETLTKLAKQSEVEIKSGAYLSTPDYWDKFLTGLDARSAGVLKDIIKILKLLTIEIKNKSQKLQQLTSKTKIQSSSIGNTLQLLKGIQTEIIKKDYFKSDEGILALENSYQNQDKVMKAFFRLVKKFSETSRSKLIDQRKLSQKSIKSYEGQLEKMNNFISQYEIKLKQKEHEYQELYKSFVELQKSSVGNAGEDQKKSSSLRGSRRSIRSNSSDKDNELKNIKASMQAFAEEQKNMLQRLEMAEQEKVALVERINYLEGQSRGSLKNNEELRATIRGLQKNMSDEHTNYQRQYEAWRQKTLAQNEQIERVRNHYERQFERRQSKIVEQFDCISKERQQALQKYHRDLSNVQNELNKQISHLRQQLRIKNVENLKLEELEVIRKDKESIQADNNFLKQKLSELEQVNIKHSQLMKDHGQLQAQLTAANSKHRQYETQINNLRIEVSRTSSLQSKANSVDQINIQNQNLVKENGQLQLQLSNSEKRSRELQAQIKKVQANFEKIIQEQRKGFKQQIDSLHRQLENKSRVQAPAPIDHSNRVFELQQELSRMRSQQQQIIENEVVAALRNQQEDFNRFLADHEKQIQAHFFNIIIPQRIKQAQVNVQPANTEILRNLEVRLAQSERIINETNSKYQQQVTRTADIERSLNQEIRKLRSTNLEVDNKLNQERNQARTLENSLREEIRNIQLKWESKYNQQTILNEKKMNELMNQRMQSKSVDEFKTIELKLEQLNRRYVEETKIRTELENKYNQSISSYQAKIQKVLNEKIMQVGQLHNQLNICTDRNNDLIRRLTMQQNHIRTLQENRERQFREMEASINRKYEQQIAYYENRIAEHNSQITSVKNSYQNSLSNFNHQDCERKYREMEQRLSREAADLRTKLGETSKSGRQEIQLLKEVINNQKLEFKNFETMINSFRQAKDEAHRQKETYFNQLKLISSEKDKQIFKLRTEYENKLTVLSIQKSTLQNKMAQSQPMQTSRTVDHSSNLKILQLQSQVNNKIQQIKQINDLSERRRRQLEQLHQKLIFADRQIDNLRVTVNNMQNHIMKLETDLSYFNNEVHKYKMALIETQSRESVLRNDLLRVKTQSDNNDSNNHLKQEISALKEEIIRITSTNIHQLHNISTSQNFDIGRIRKMIHQIEAQRNGQKYGYNEDEMQILRRINEEVTELVAANRQLQTKCIIMESQIDGNSRFRENIDIFVLLQDRMENLMNFLLDKSIVDNTENYSKFMYSSKEILSVQDIEGYFNNWLNFMKSMFLIANDLKSEQLRQKAEEMIELKEQMNQILDKHIEFVEDESYETLDKYKMIFSDIKILMREYINTRNEEYLQMIWRSLEPHD